jgi:polar amino acid transport system substrate-binding protein
MQKFLGVLAVSVVLSSAAMAQNTVAPGGTLRAVFLAGNPAQAVRDPASGEIRGASADLARELAKRLNIPVALLPSPTPATVIEAVNKGDADIGFVAYAPSRTGTVEFSQTYMLVRQSFLVADGSPIKSVNEIDRAGQKIGGSKGDSITLFLARVLKQATLVETDSTSVEDAKQKLLARDIDAFGANRQRLTYMMQEMPGYRLLPDNIFDVPQTIVVGKGRTEALTTINKFIDDVRTSGFLKAAIEASRIAGLDVAPSGYGYGQAEAR